MKSFGQRSDEALNISQCILATWVNSWSLISLFLGNTSGHVVFSYFVRILARSWDFDRACPVEVEMAQSIAQMLDFKASQVRVVAGNIEVSRKHTSLIGRTRCEVEVELLCILMCVN